MCITDKKGMVIDIILVVDYFLINIYNNEFYN